MRNYITIALVLITAIGFSQSWKGTLDAGGQKIELFLVVEAKGTAHTSYWKIPAQNLPKLPSSDTQMTTDSIKVSIKMIQGAFKARKLADQSLDGQWEQSGYKIPLKMTPCSAADLAQELVRPQTPKAPFPYQVEDIQYKGSKTGLTYGATLTHPTGSSPAPALILITGSGQQDRDENILSHKPFALIADYLTRKGWAVLRIDDRGKGKTTGNFAQSTTLDFADDVREHIAYLKTRTDIDSKRIGLCGHSEGGLIAPMVAASDASVAFTILLAGPGVTCEEVMVSQNKALLAEQGWPEESLNKYLDLYRAMFKEAYAKSTESLTDRFAKKVTDWMKTTPEATVSRTTGITDEASKSAFVKSYADAFDNPWWHTFAGLDPAPYLKKVRCPILALNGSKDVQIVADINLEGIRQNTMKNKQVRIQKMEGLNHLFQKCTQCTVAEYGTIETTMEPEVLAVMAEWLNGLAVLGKK
ncbi:MAG: hypothetical protein CFE24_13450 [Flavobacterium sp. BFFFF2]|nr:MAG: hypothetical protein CFE24_13450 [Flavobacterium sp. BFFFF2]